MAAQPRLVGRKHLFRTKGPLSGETAGQGKRHFRIVGGLTGKRSVKSASFQIVHTRGVHGAHRFLILEFHLTAQGIPGDLTEQAAPCAAYFS